MFLPASAFGAILAAVLLGEPVALAQSHAEYCASRGGVPDGTEGAGEWGCREAGSTNYQAAPSDPGAVLRARWQALQAGALAGTEASRMPVGGDEEFSAAMGRAFDELSRSAAVMRARADEFDARSAYELNVHERFYAPRFSRIDASDDLAPWVRSARDSVRAEHRRLTDDAQRLRSLRERVFFKAEAGLKARNSHRARALEAKKTVYVVFGGLERKDIENASPWEGLAMGDPTPRKVPFIPVAVDPFWHSPSGDYSAFSRMKEAEKAAKNAYSYSPEPPPPGLEARMSRVEAAAQAASAAAERLKEAERRYRDDVHAWYTVSDEKTWARITAKNKEVQDETSRLSDSDIPQAEAELEGLRRRFNEDAREAMMNGAHAAAWSIFKKHVIDPEVKGLESRLKGAGMKLVSGQEFSKEGIEAAWKSDKRGLYAQYKGIKGLKGKLDKTAAVVKTTLDLAGYGQEAMSAAATALAKASPDEIMSLGDEVFGGLDNAARAQTEAAMKAVELPAGFKAFWKRYFEAPRPAEEAAR